MCPRLRAGDSQGTCAYLTRARTMPFNTELVWLQPATDAAYRYADLLAPSSLGFEDTDAAAFIDWGFDFIKHDTCGTDCPIHNGCIQNATARMAKAIYEHGRGETVYYLDSGNPTSPQRVYNPYNRGVHDDEALLKVAVRPSELVWNWATRLPHGPHLFKSWFDRSDTWPSFLTNVHNQGNGRTNGCIYAAFFFPRPPKRLLPARPPPQ